MRCQFCLQEKKLVKAHIIPEYFHRELRREAPYLYLLSTDKPHPKRSPVGEYDSEILCSDCEQLMAKWDDVGIQFFQGVPDWQKNVYPNGAIYTVSDFDYTGLKLFFVSMLWRAHISDRDFCKHVKLGPYADKALTLLKNNHPGSDRDFTCVLFKFAPSKNMPGQFHRYTTDPFYRRYAENKFYQFQLNEFGIFIKVDNKTLRYPFNAVALRQNSPLFIIERDFDTSPETEVLFHVVRKVKEANANWQQSRQGCTI